MKYVCKICGYVYDNEKEKINFEDLPDSWVCPLCGANKSDFEAQGVEIKKSEKPKESIEIDEDMLRLSTAQLSALFSNLARGCEKQYKDEGAKLYLELSNYFKTSVDKDSASDISDIKEKLDTDIKSGYFNARKESEKLSDRGALRAITWGEKVSYILNSLIERYEKEGEEFLNNNEVWVCTICGFVYIGKSAPKLCPVCKVPDWKFEKIEGRA